jgi:hypothetical protein
MQDRHREGRQVQYFLGHGSSIRADATERISTFRAKSSPNKKVSAICAVPLRICRIAKWEASGTAPVLKTGLTALAFMKWAFGAAAGSCAASVGITGGIYRTQGDGIAASRAVISVVLQNNKWNERLIATLGTNYKCFTSCHTRISFRLRASYSPIGFLPRTISRNAIHSFFCSK